MVTKWLLLYSMLLHEILRKMPSGYQVTRLPVTFVIHNMHATINIMVTKWLLLYSKLLCEILRKMPSGYQVTRLPVTL